MKSKLTVVMIALLVSAVLASPCWCADATKIGVVRFTALVNGYKRMQGEQDASVKKRTRLQQDQDTKQSEINTLTAKLQQHTPDSEAYKKTDAELREKKAAMDTWMRVKQDELITEDTRIMREVYEDVEAAASDFGKKNGYSLILKEDDLDLGKASIAELKIKVALRKVLYSDPSIDVTDALLKVLNDKFTARAK